MNAYGQWAAESGAATGHEPVNDADALRTMGTHHHLSLRGDFVALDVGGELLADFVGI